MSSILEKDTQLVFPVNFVVSASAGSGKTYTLTQRYIQFLLSQRIPNNSLRGILAITFTNLAAKEMRQNVLDYMKAMSLGRSRQISEMANLVSLDAATLRQRADMMVEQILANYSEFQVKTIDSFMVSIFKASAIDFGFSPDVEIELTDDTLIDEAFDAYSREFGSRPEQAALLDHLIDLLSQSREGRKRFLWDPYKTLAEEVKDLYELISSQPRPPLIDVGGDAVKDLRRQITLQASNLHSMLTSLNLPIQRNMEKDLLQAIAGDVDSVIGRTLKDKAVGKLIGPKMDRTHEQHRQEIEEALARYNDLIKEYCLVRARTYYTPYLKAIEEVRDVLDALKRRQGRLFIHDINKKLVDTLVRENVPEVYFRLGETIYHFLIDEFQDTAPIQWANLRPLVENSLAGGKGSLFIVGDTKQSIYGFRFADWMIMRRLKEDSNEFPSAIHKGQSLDTNWRSDERIVEFVRSVFEEVIPLTDWADAGRLSALDKCSQQVTDRHRGKGYVESCWFERDEDTQHERGKIIEIINDCRARGHQLGDIALLTPNNEDVIRVSGWLNQQDIPFVSHSSLDIRTRKITGEILALLQFFDSPIDDLSFSSFLLSDLFQATLQHHGEPFSKEQIRSLLFAEAREEYSPLYKSFQMRHADIWRTYFEDLYTRAGYLPLYDFISELYKIFDVFAVARQQEGTLVKLLDVVKMFEERGNSSIKGFLSFALDTAEGSGWEMDVPPEGDAVTLMTIHKAKGLDFPVVVVLLYEWRESVRPYTVEECQDGIRILRISEKDAEKVASLAVLYNDQKMKNRADDLNKLYVALTRAEEEMYVVTVFDPVKGEKNCVPSKFFPDRGYEAVPKPPVQKRPERKRQTLKTFHQTIRRPYELAGVRRFPLVEMARGEVVHAVLAQIESIEGNIEDQVDRSLQKVASAVRVSRDDIRATLIEFLHDERVKEFFVSVPGRRVLCEQEFANASGMVYRLDRVLLDEDTVAVLDFKTGGDEAEEEHREQVLNYMSLLHEVFPGTNVTGFLAYVDKQEVKKVT